MAHRGGNDLGVTRHAGFRSRPAARRGDCACVRIAARTSSGRDARAVSLLDRRLERYTDARICADQIRVSYHRSDSGRAPSRARPGWTPRIGRPGMSEPLRKIDHIGIAVPDLDAAVAAFTALFGSGPDSVEEVAEQKVRTAFFSAGETNVELLFPTAEDSPISSFLAKRGAGIHHICFEVANIERALADYQAQGLRLIDATPRIGAHGKRIAFLHPKSTGGILIELCEVPHRTGCDPHPRTPHAANPSA
jgi:methylmalonyl-CoA/ethylmalonyl-CoA epimerase